MNLLRYLLYPANLFLFFVIGIALLWSNFNITHQFDFLDNSSSIQALVLNEKRNNFNQVSYNIWANNQTLELNTKVRLVPGDDILINGGEYEYTKYILGDGNEASDYYLSIGKKGEIKTESVLLNQNCDLRCNFIKYQARTKRWIANKYYKASCITHEWITVNMYEGDCKDVFALSYGLILGGSEKFSQEAKKTIKTSGTSHIVAVSGFQVVLVMSFVERFSKLIALSPRYKYILYIIFVGLLIALVGPQAPVIRSSLSILIASAFTIFLGRDLGGLRALVYSGALMLFFNPFYIDSISFQLSFLASFALLFVNSSSDYEFSWIQGVWSYIGSSILAYLYTMPIIMLLQENSNLFSVITNIFVVPIIPFVSLVNLLGLLPIVGPVFMAVGIILQSVVLWIIQASSNSNWFGAGNFNLSFDTTSIVLYYSTLTILLIKIKHINWLKYYDRSVIKRFIDSSNITSHNQ